MIANKRMSFRPAFTITPALASGLMRIEAVRQSIRTLPITPAVLANLRESARLMSTHYSTMIEGNRLTQEQVAQVIGGDQHFPALLKDAFYRIASAAEIVGAWAVLVHAIDTEAKAFYERFNFDEIPAGTLHMMLSLKDIRAAIAGET